MCLLCTLALNSVLLKQDLRKVTWTQHWVDERHQKSWRALRLRSLSPEGEWNLFIYSGTPLPNQFPLSVGITGSSATYSICYIEFHLAWVVWRFNLVVSRSLICLTFTNGVGRPFQAAPRQLHKYILERACQPRPGPLIYRAALLIDSNRCLLIVDYPSC